MAFETIDEYVAEVGGRRLAAGEWGLRLEAGGTPLEVGLRVAGGLLRAQAWVAPAGRCGLAVLLHRNRSLALVRYATTRAGDVWVVGDVPATGDAPVDRLLGALVEAAAVVRAS